MLVCEGQLAEVLTMTKYELTPKFDRCKSFYKKAYVHLIGDIKYLESYDSTVVTIYADGVCTLQTAASYSMTTRRHVNEFLLQEGIVNRALSKKEIEALIGNEFKTLSL